MKSTIRSSWRSEREDCQHCSGISPKPCPRHDSSPPVKKLPAFKVDKAYVYRTVGKRQGNIREVIVAHCAIGGNGRAQAYRYARLFAAAPHLLEACRSALLRDDVAKGELGDLLRAAINAAGEL